MESYNFDSESIYPVLTVICLGFVLIKIAFLLAYKA